MQITLRLIVGVMLLAILAGCDALGGQAEPVIRSTTITLHYNDSSVVIQNTGENRMENPAGLDFVRGNPAADSDDYGGERITSGPLTPGECYTLVRRNSEPLVIPACTANNGIEIMTNITGLFWRTEPIDAASFNIYWNNEPIHNCASYSITDTGIANCSFVYPPAAP